MSKYLLDTDTLIDFSKDREPTKSRLLRMIEDEEELGVCAINITEFYAGIPQDNRSLWDEFFRSLVYWPITASAARLAGIMRHDLARAGRVIDLTDTTIAAVAVEEGATVITTNASDYAQSNVPMLSLREEGGK